MQNLVWKTKQWLEEQKIIPSGTHGRTGIVVGVSGGADSVCLLCVLAELAVPCGLSLAAVHVHHGIRGAEADRDAEFVRTLCAELSVPVRVEYRDIPAAAAQKHLTVEEAGRAARYEIFEQVRKECGAAWVAVAHHCEDQAETVLLNLFRGSGVRGMGGIRPVQGCLIRPLLGASRQEIETYLRIRGIGWCTDSTNQETDAARNVLRLRILPEIRAVWPEMDVVLCRSAGQFAAAADYMRTQAEQFLDGQQEETADGGFSLSVAALKKLHPALRSEALYEALCRAAGCRKDLTARHVDALLQLCEGQSGRKVAFPYQVAVQRSFDRLIFEKKGPEGAGRRLPEVFMRVVSAQEAEKIEENDCTKRFAYDKLDKFPVLRFRQPGDRIVLYADGRGKKLQDFLVDRKIPARNRDQIPVLALDQEVLWIVGLRVSQKYRVGAETEQVLVVTVR